MNNCAYFNALYTQNYSTWTLLYLATFTPILRYTQTVLLRVSVHACLCVCMHVFVCACACTRVYNRVWVCSSGQQYSLLNHEPPSTLLVHRHMPLSQLQHTISIEEIHWNLFSPFFKQQRGISSWGYNENHNHKHRWVFQTCLLVWICVFSSRHARASAHITHVIRCAHHQPHMDTSTFLSD